MGVGRGVELILRAINCSEVRVLSQHAATSDERYSSATQRECERRWCSCIQKKVVAEFSLNATLNLPTTNGGGSPD